MSYRHNKQQAKKYLIQIRNRLDGSIMKTIKRVLHAKQIGNFNPIFCTYKYKTYLVKSDEGDLSDPFRREENYAKSFYIIWEGYFL